MQRDNPKVLVILTIIINTIVILLILNRRNPWLLAVIAALFLTIPSILALLAEKYLKVAIDDERRELIVNRSSLETIYQYIILSTLIGTILLLGNQIISRSIWSSNLTSLISVFAIIVITTGLVVGWTFAFTNDFQIKLSDESTFKVQLKDLMSGIMSTLLIFLYVNHFAILMSGSEKSILASLFDVEKNWLILFYILLVLNLIGFKIYNLKFGPSDERTKLITQSSSAFTIKLVNMILLTFSLLSLIMLLISWDDDLVLIGVSTFLAYSFLKGNYLLNIRKASIMYS